jgi:hypothetical protein
MMRHSCIIYDVGCSTPPGTAGAKAGTAAPNRKERTMEQQTSTLRETWAQAVHRLALLAEERGITVHWHDRGAIREYFATSGSKPGLLYRVTLHSCDCEGFIRHQRCSHFARLLAEVGELPPLPTPPTPAAMAERRAGRVAAMSPHHAAHIEAEARAWLESLIAKQDAGEPVKQADIDEATTMVARYAAITSPPVLLAA